MAAMSATEIKALEAKVADLQVSDLFQKVKKRRGIFLIDRSGSTGSNANVPTERHLTVFDRMAQICGELAHDENRLVFWSSPSYKEGRFINGQMILPFVVRKDSLATAFATAAMAPGGGTCPALGFQGMVPAWLEDDPMVYLITDGQIGCSEVSDAINRRMLAEEIRKLPCQLTIVAVENIARDFNRVEQVDAAAGGDIFKIVREERLTDKISKFVSYGPNGSFTQINKVRAPAGYASYGDEIFSVLRVPEFMEFIVRELRKDAGEAAQLAIAQKLSVTLEALTRDKPVRVADDIVRTFSRLFTIDADMVHWIMTGAIQQERGGQAQVFANYRAQLKNLFAQADGLLKQDVCAALSMNGEFVSMPVGDRVLTGSYRLVDKTVTIHGTPFPRGGFTAGLPVFPLLTAATRLTELQDQCLRQWIRAVYAAVYRVHPTADEIIYLLLGDMLKVCTSSAVSDKIKNAYRLLAQCILRKKRLNSIQTEMDRLMAGELPIPNSGKFEDFETYMRSVSAKLGLEGVPLKLWYDICLALDPMLAVRQKAHCTEFITQPLETKVQEDFVPESASLDYNCFVTLDDISLVGGFQIKSHVGIAGNCAPVYLVSADGKRQMLASGQCACPVCYTRLNEADFSLVGPKIPFDLPDSYGMYAGRFAEAPVAGHGGGGQQRNGQQRNKQHAPAQAQVRPGGIRNANGNVGKLVIMKGTVGSGKSSAAAAIKAAVEARGGVCIVEGTDKYCKDGMHVRDAVVRVQQALAAVSEVKNDDVVVVIDTCGERTNRGSLNNIFNTDFTGWTYIEVFPNLDRTNMPGYFAWSLRNVLMRGAPKKELSHNLNPVTATVAICIDVHKNKSKALFNQQQFRAWQFAGATVANLAALADAYALSLPAFAVPREI